MLNKKDPLIGAVQEVMKKNQAEREAAKLVNEKFGVHDRKALPHEKQGEWDAAYKTVLTEGAEALDEAKLSPEHKSVITQKLQKIHGKGKVKFGPNGATWSDGIDQRTHDVTVNKSGKVKMDSSPYLESELEEEKSFAALAPPYDKATQKDRLVGAGVLKKHPTQPGKHILAKEEEQIDEAGMMPTGIKKVLGRLKAGWLADKYNNRALGDDPYQRTPPENYKKDIEQAIKYKRIENRLRKEDVTSPSSMGIKKPDYAPAGTTPDYAKPKEQTVNRAAKTSLPPGTMKEEMTDDQMKKREKIVMSMKKKMPGFKKRYGKRAKDVMYATATKQAMKEDNEGFNNRHGMSVTASAKKQAVAEQVKARSDYGLGAIPAQKNAAQRRAELDAKMEKGIDTVAPFIPGVGAARAIDKYSRGEQGLGQTAADVGLNLAGGALVKGAAKGFNYLRNLGKAKQKTNIIPRLSAPKTAKPVSQAAREPANVAQAAKVAPKQTRPVSQAAREPDEIIPPKRPASQTGNAGIRGTFQDKLARARQNAGSDLKARQLPALRRTTEPTNYVRPGLPAVRPTTSTAVARPGMPNLAAGGATRVVGLSDKAKLGLGAGAAAIGTTALSRSLNNQPQPAAAASKTSGPSFEKTGRGTAPPLSSGAEKIKTSTQTTTTQPDYDKMTFSQAFKTARQQAGGASGKFKYKGKEYQTNVQGTGTAKKPQEKYQAASKLKTVAPAPVTKTTTSVMGGQGIAAIPGGASKLAAKPAVTSATNNTRRVGPDGQGGLTVGQNKPMGMSFTPKTTVDTVKKPAASVTPQMSQSVSSLQQKASMAGKERGLSPNFAKTELTRRQNIQTVKGA